MTPSPGRINPVIAVPASLLVWILLLALNMHAMLGAGITGDWIVTGVLITFAAIFVLWLVNEVVSAVDMQVVGLKSLGGLNSPWARNLVRAKVRTEKSWRDQFDVSIWEQQRQALGLHPCRARGNRPRRSR